MTKPESEQATQSLSERAAREWAEKRLRKKEKDARYRKANPIKYLVIRRTVKAITQGYVKRPSKCCMETAQCGGRIEAHHVDYSKPRDITWLCAKHHRAWHRVFEPVVPEIMPEPHSWFGGLYETRGTNSDVRSRGENNRRATLTDERVREVRQFFSNGERLIDVSRRLGISRGTLWNIKAGRSWKHLLPTEEA